MHLHNTQKNKLHWSSAYSEEHIALCLGHPAEFIGFIGYSEEIKNPLIHTLTKQYKTTTVLIKMKCI
jgi:hypothetical protein